MAMNVARLRQAPRLRATTIRVFPTNPSSTRSLISAISSRTPDHLPLTCHRSISYGQKEMAEAAATGSSSPDPSISPGSNEHTVKDTLKMELLPPHSHWSLTPSGTGIQRTFKFKTFKAAWSFMDRVAQECKTARHHPEWANVYNTVFVRWTTHEPKGLSEKDVAMAMFCDEHARELGVIAEEGGGEGVKEGEGVACLANGLAEAAGDCCVPKKK